MSTAASRLVVRTNCGHAFCGSCILAYWQRACRPAAVTCPCCRRLVNLLHYAGEREPAVRTLVNNYNRRYSGAPRSLLDSLRDVPTLVRLAVTDVRTGALLITSGVGLHVCLAVLGAALYLLSPLDVIPEAAFGVLGLLDDCLIIAIALLFIAHIYRAFVVRSALAARRRAAAAGVGAG